MNFERKKNRSQNQFFIDFSMRLKEKKNLKKIARGNWVGPMHFRPDHSETDTFINTEFPCDRSHE